MSHWEVLGIPVGADEGTIRRAYRRLARRWHPEMNPEDPAAEDRFLVIVEAYTALTGGRPRRGSPVARRAGAADRQPASEESRRTVGGGAAPLHGAPQEEVAAELHLELGEAIFGTTASLTLHREQPCPACRGQTDVSGCDRCGGRREVVALQRHRLRVPAGVEDGGWLRIHPAGSASPVMVRLRVEAHPYFERRGNDVYAELPITIREAVLGAEIDVPTVHGPARTRIPGGTESGRRLRLRGRGVAGRDGKRGDHYCRIRIVIPRHLREEDRARLELLQEPNPRAGLPALPLVPR